MRDTDWRPSPCPHCGVTRAAAENPVCENPNCKGRDMQEEMDLEADVTDMKETPAERFRRVVNPRLGKVVERMRLLRQMFEGANARNYEYTPEQAAKLVKVLQDEVDEIKRLTMSEQQRNHIPTI